MNRGHLYPAALAVLILATGCGKVARSSAPLPPSRAESSGPASPSSSPASPSSTVAAQATAPVPPAFAEVMPLLRPAQMPVYLPAWLPPLPAGESYYFTGQAAAGSYNVGIAMSQAPAAVNSLPDLPNTDQIGHIAGGEPGKLGPDPTVPTPSGPGEPENIGSGVHGTYYPQPPGGDYSLLQWQVGGWIFQVADVTGLGAPASRLRTYAQQILADAPPGSPPVPGVSTGTVVQTLSPDGAPTWVLWQRGVWAYRVEAHNAPAVRVAHSMILVAG